MRLVTVVIIAAAFIVFPDRADADAAAADADAPATKRLAVVAIQNGDTDTERTHLADTGYFRNAFFGGTGSLATWMPAVTHGMLNFSPAGDGVFTTAPNDALRNGDKTKCLTDAARTTAEQFLTAQGVSWDSLAVVFDIGSCGWGGLGQMPGRITWYPPKPSLSAIVHEIGHNLGYPHEQKRDCAGGSIAACKTNGYSGNTPMGSGGAGRGYSSVELLHSGWVEASWLTRTNKPGAFSLKPLYAPTSVTGTRVVEFQTGTNTSYVIETRALQPSGVDSAITSPGVRVYSVSGKDYKNAQMINAGGSVITDTANKITISVRSPTLVEVAPIGAKPTSPAPIASPSEMPSPAPEISLDPDTPDDLVDNASPAVAEPSSVPISPLLFVIAGIAIAVTLAAAAGINLYLHGRRGKHVA